jgi:hypothetical protein
MHDWEGKISFFIVRIFEEFLKREKRCILNRLINGIDFNNIILIMILNNMMLDRIFDRNIDLKIIKIIYKIVGILIKNRNKYP